MENILEIKSGLAEEIKKRTKENVFLCYQCNKCTSGCPVVEDMDLTPSQIIRALQFGMEKEVLESKTIWLCVSCETCSTRCPQDIDIARLMDYLREKSISKDIKPAVREVPIFNDIALKGILKKGRLYELGSLVRFNIRTGNPFKDLNLGVKMLLKGKIEIMPPKAKFPKDISKIKELPKKNEKSMAYYSGCSLHSVGREFNLSTKISFKKLGLELHEPDNWICCGSTPAHEKSHFLATLLPLKNLLLIEKLGLKSLTLPCALCFQRFKKAVYDIENDKELKKKIDEELGLEFNPTIKINHVIDTLLEKVGLEEIGKRVEKPLGGLKVACYYGCLLTRPPKVTGKLHYEYPRNMDKLMKKIGTEAVDWSYKTECCGAALSVTKTDISLRLISDILENARNSGAEIIVTACPMCQSNLETRQHQIEKKAKKELPVVYFTQLLALALGVKKEELGFKKNLLNPLSFFEKQDWFNY